MSDIEIPNFGELLGPHLSGVSTQAYPYLLSQLERTAAARYRGWADDVPDHREGLLACAAREDDIANRVERMFPPTQAQREEVQAIMPAARDAYYAVFDGYSPMEQMTIQANAERQGANAWQNLKQVYEDRADELDRLSSIEIESADYLDMLLRKQV